MIQHSPRSFYGFTALGIICIACHHAEFELPASAGGVAGSAGGEGTPVAGGANFGGAGGEAGAGGPAAGGGEAGADAAGGEAGAVLDTTPPRVLSVSPGESERGVLKDVNVVIRFSEPMNQASTVNAVVGTLGSAVQATWNDDGTELTLDPDADFEYATGTNPLATAPRQYSFAVGVGALDLAGNALTPAFSSTFYAAREFAANMTQVDALDGYVIDSGNPFDSTGYADPLVGDATDVPIKGFVTFDFQRLPAPAQAVTQATLSATQASSEGEPFTLGNLNLDHVSFSAIGLPAFNAVPDPSYGVFFRAPATAASKDVTVAVQADFAVRAVNSDRSQFRFAFDKSKNENGTSDTLRLYPINLRVWYLIP